jgi:hypothetical protein
MDTGVEVTVIASSRYLRCKNQAEFYYGPAKQPLKVLGQFSGKLTYGEHSHQGKVFVVKQLHNNLLGLPAITSLQLIQRVDAVYKDANDIVEQFPQVFTGLGNLGEEYIPSN